MSKLYRVVEIWADFEGKVSHVKKDIGCAWKSEQQAAREMKELATKRPGMSFGIEVKQS
jgi:hypothetical protein